MCAICVARPGSTSTALPCERWATRTSSCSATPPPPRILGWLARNWRSKVAIILAADSQRADNGRAPFVAMKTSGGSRFCAAKCRAQFDEWFEDVARYLKLDRSPVHRIRCRRARNASAMRTLRERDVGSAMRNVVRSAKPTAARRRRAGADVRAVTRAGRRIESHASWCRRWRSITQSTACRPLAFDPLRRARQGGAGWSFTEMTCVSPEGRITPGCTGLYRRDMKPRGTDRRLCPRRDRRTSPFSLDIPAPKARRNLAGKRWMRRCPPVIGR